MVSVVFSTYQRGHYMARSLQSYANQSLSVPFQLVVVDDGSTDGTQALCEEWREHLDITYVKVEKQPGLWRDCAMTLNQGLRAARGELVIGTHPEVMPGRTSLQALWDMRMERAYLACKVYYLTPEDQQQLDSVPWREEGALAVRQLPNFYPGVSAEHRGHPDYTHEATDRHTTWESFVFGGFTRETWRWFGGFTEFETWGSIDVDFLNRRRILGIPCLTPLAPETIVVHQNHDIVVQDTDVLTPRDMERALGNLPHYSRPEEARRGYL